MITFFQLISFHLMDIKNIEKDLNYFGGGLLLSVNENMPRRALIAAQIDLNFDFFVP